MSHHEKIYFLKFKSCKITLEAVRIQSAEFATVMKLK